MGVYAMATGATQIEAAIKAALDEFAAGLDGKRPEPRVTEMAARIANAAVANTREPEISVDVDGALSFDLELPGGRLLLAELEIDGRIDASLYDSEKRNIIKNAPSHGIGDYSPAGGSNLQIPRAVSSSLSMTGSKTQ